MTNPAVKTEREEQRRLFELRGNPVRMVGVPANINRRTGEPHKNLRQK